MTDGACFHCALPLDPDNLYHVKIDGSDQPVCCPGCKAVAELIRDTGLTSYYARREAPPPGAGRPPDDLGDWALYDTDDMLNAFARVDADGAEVSIYAGGMYCAACSWLIETTLSALPAVRSADVNPVTHRVQVRWDPAETGLGGILGTLAGLGYEPQPLAPDSIARPEVAEQRTALKRLLIASLGMMQAMMFAIGLYAGDFQGMAPDMQFFLRLVSFLVTTPVVFYSARPFFVGAWRGVINRRPGMDLPVAIAVGAAYVASIWSMLNQGEAVWFDSVAMFVFFLTLGRFLEMRARHRSIDRSRALSNVLPNTAERVDGNATVTVPVSQLQPGDEVRVRSGEAVPADGTLMLGETTVDEALLTGESTPQRRAAGDRLVAGSVNLGERVTLQVDAVGTDTTLGTISRLSERARYARPAFVQLADRVAAWIVVAILLVAAAVAAYWGLTDPDRAFVITLSVLVVTCPCALALATPAAFAAAGTRLAELRLLLTNGNAIEALARADRIVFDKTGTLTLGRPAVTAVEIIEPGHDEHELRRIAGSLEQQSTHPLARAFAVDAPLPVSNEQVVVGEGVSGLIDGVVWKLGRSSFAGAAPDADNGGTEVWLARNEQPVARFSISDPEREDAADVVTALRQAGLQISLASGDNAAAVAAIAARTGIDDSHANCKPEDKLAFIRGAQAKGETVIMVGDGINDAPVLGGADASVAMAEGALLAQTSADLVMLGERLQPLLTAVQMARQTLRIVRQNLAWALVYNALALPLAAAGLVPPWAAAIGMSSSSLIVVLNSLRLSRFNRA